MIRVKKFLGKSNPWSPHTRAIDDSATGTGPNIHNNKGKLIQRTRLPTTANPNPLSKTVFVYSSDDDDVNSPKAFIKKLASIKFASAIELHKKLLNKKIEVSPYFSTTIFPVGDPKIVPMNRWFELKALLVRAAKDKVIIIVIEAVRIVAINAFLKL